MNWIKAWVRKARMLHAAEQHAYWKAKKEAKIEIAKITGLSQYDEDVYVKAAANEAKYAERVEWLMRQ